MSIRLLFACSAVAAALAVSARASDHYGRLPEAPPLSPRGQPVVGFPDGAPAASSELLRLTDEDIRQLRARGYTAGIAMQALDTPWNALQVEAITTTLADYGIKVVSVTDAAQDPRKQSSQLQGLIERKVDVLFSVPIDPSSQEKIYRRVSAAGIKLVLMDNVPFGLTPSANYVTVVASDNEKNAAFATEELIRGVGGSGDIALINFSFPSYYSIAARVRGFEKVVRSNPGVRIAAVITFTQPREVYDKMIALLTNNPSIKGVFAVWGDPAMQAIAAAKAVGRTDLVVTTNDLGPDTALHVARGEIRAIGAQLPYDLGVAEAKAAAIALVGKAVPPYISLPAIRVTKANLLSSLRLVTKRDPPEAVIRACKGDCGEP